MKKKLYPFFVLIFVFFLSSCGPKVKLSSSWLEPGMQGYKAQDVLVLGVSRSEVSLKLWESVFAEKLAAVGVRAMESNKVIGVVPEPDRGSVEDAITRAGAHAVLITHVVDRSEKTHTYPGTIHFEPRGYYTGMYGYYNSIYRAVYTPPVDKTKTKVCLESNLYDVSTARLVWSAQSEVVDPKLLRTDFEKIVGVLMADMKKEGLL